MHLTDLIEHNTILTSTTTSSFITSQHICLENKRPGNYVISTFLSLCSRYVAICHPMKAHAMSGLKRVVRVIIIIWIMAAILSVPQTVQYKVVYAVDRRNKTISESAYCGIGEDSHIERTFEISTFLLFVFPMTLVTVMYTMIAIAIRRSELIRDGSDASHRERLTGVEIRVQQQARARRSVLKMLGKFRSNISKLKKRDLTFNHFQNFHLWLD